MFSTIHLSVTNKQTHVQLMATCSQRILHKKHSFVVLNLQQNTEKPLKSVDINLFLLDLNFDFLNNNFTHLKLSYLNASDNGVSPV